MLRLAVDLAKVHCTIHVGCRHTAITTTSIFDEKPDDPLGRDRHDERSVCLVSYLLVSYGGSERGGREKGGGRRREVGVRRR